MKEIIINNHEGMLTVSSLQVAKDFKKRPADVHESIENLTTENSAVKAMFMETTYVNERGREYKCYEMTRDGFCLLVMGFTGKKALDWKLKYIDAFNQMEEQLRSNQLNLESIITMTVTATLKALMPMLNQETVIDEVAEPTKVPTKRKRLPHRTHSVISRLDPALRKEVDEILIAGEKTYAETQMFLLEHGVKVSISAIGKYSQNLMKNNKQKGD